MITLEQAQKLKELIANYKKEVRFFTVVSESDLSDYYTRNRCEEQMDEAKAALDTFIESLVE